MKLAEQLREAMERIGEHEAEEKKIANERGLSLEQRLLLGRRATVAKANAMLVAASFAREAGK